MLMEPARAAGGRGDQTNRLVVDALDLIGMAVCQLIYGPASDKFGRRPLLLAGLSLFFIASVLAAIAPSIEMLIAARLIQAIGGSAGIVLARAMVRDVFTREKSASVISYITMAFVVAPMIAPVLGGFLEQYSSWRTGFWLLAIVGAILTFIRNYSLIPVLGALCCMYLLIEIPVISWLWFFVWMGIGLLIYSMYGYRKSRAAMTGS